MIYIACLACCLVAYLVARWLAGAAGAWGQRRGVVSEVTERSSHVKPTSRLAGTGLLGGALAGFALWLVIARAASLAPLAGQGRLLLWILAGWLLMFAVGLLDDLYDLKPMFKLKLEVVAALLPLIGGLGWTPASVEAAARAQAAAHAPAHHAAPAALHHDAAASSHTLVLAGGAAVTRDATTSAGLAAAKAAAAKRALAAKKAAAHRRPPAEPGLLDRLSPIKIIGGLVVLGWILFFVNAYNFMDGMDGFAANFARFAALFICLAAARGHVVAGAPWTVYSALPLLLAASASGFLVWNSPPAKFFMGDGGSLSTGYLLAVLALLGHDQRLGGRVSLVGSQIILLPFTFDVALTLIRRWRHGENLLKAHRTHLYQRLMQTGLSHAQVLRVNLGLFAACGALGVIAAPLPLPLGVAVGLAALGCMLLYWRLVLQRERFFHKA